MGPTKRGKGSKLMAIADRHGLPVAVDVASASPAEVKLVISTLEARFLPDLPERLIGDKAYDSDPLAAKLAEGAVELIAPHRSNRKVKTQDGRPLRRYCRRWKIERLFAWLYNFRRLVTRWESDVINFLGFVQLGCVVSCYAAVCEMASKLKCAPHPAHPRPRSVAHGAGYRDERTGATRSGRSIASPVVNGEGRPSSSRRP